MFAKTIAQSVAQWSEISKEHPHAYMSIFSVETAKAFGYVYFFKSQHPVLDLLYKFHTEGVITGKIATLYDKYNGGTTVCFTDETDYALFVLASQ